MPATDFDAEVLVQDEPRTRETTEFNGKRVLVTGGTKGIGEAIVKRLLRGGATVIATARSAPAAGERLIAYTEP